MWDLPGPGLEPVSPALADGFLTSAPPGKPLWAHLDWLVPAWHQLHLSLHPHEHPVFQIYRINREFSQVPRPASLGLFLQLTNSHLSFKAQLRFSSALVLVTCPSSVFPQLCFGKVYGFCANFVCLLHEMVNFWRRRTPVSSLFLMLHRILKYLFNEGASKRMHTVMVLWTAH